LPRPPAAVKAILYEIVNTQNLQIQAMNAYLEAKQYPEQDNCKVYVATIPEEIALESATGSGGGSHGAPAVLAASMALLFLGALVQMW
jgi:hypothetical protein